MNAHLGVSIIDVDVHRDHEEDSNGDAEISNQTPDLVKQALVLHSHTVYC